MFKVFKLKPFLIVVMIIVLSIILSVGVISVVGKESPKSVYTIVVDAGHGGRDNGCSGSGGSKESEINLQVAKELKKYLESYGIKVVLTRADGNGLYSADATNFKESDMANRMKIINDTNPNMVISIHQNSFTDSTVKGAQAFYQENYEESKLFAEGVQSQLLSQLPNAKSECNKGDYYLLKESNYPSIIVECGYLTNKEEESMLMTEEYREKVAYAIMCGVVKYFDLCGND